jgi:hypothetical protein
MDNEIPALGNKDSPKAPRRRSLWVRMAGIVAVMLVVYLVVAYVAMPLFWDRYAVRHPALDDIPGITMTADKIPGDPINVALVGTKTEIMKIMVAAKWYPADPLTLRSCLEIAEATVLKRPDDEAPVSSLYLWGRKEDLAFEKPVGDNPRQRHHVRFWRSEKVDRHDRPIWAGAAIYDERVGLSHTTGQITHHTAPNIDAERDFLFADLEKTGDLSATRIVIGFHKILSGRNGGGDPWETDGRLFVGVIAAEKLK